MRAVSRKMIVLGAAVAALFLTGCGSGSPASMPAAPPDFFGVNPGTAPDSRDFREMANAGVETMRGGLRWSSVQPRPGPYNWHLTDATIGGLAAQGLGYLPILASTPSWVASKPTTPPIASPRVESAWQGFLGAAVARYGPDGSFWQPTPGGGQSPFHALCGCDADPVPITSWQIWNEPNLVNYFTASPKVSSYAELLRISDDAIKTADPHAEIVLAGLPGFAATTGPTAWQFLRQLLDQPGVNGAFDVVALHPYSRDVGELGRQIQKVRTVMADNGDGAKPLWLTELGWGSEPPDQFELNKGIQGQKRLLDQSFAYLLRVQEQWRLDRVYWFEWRDPPPSAHVPCGFCSSAGLLRDDRQPKPAYHAFTSFSLGAAS
jgi:polysaccharide biosynthesis protein PslG